MIGIESWIAKTSVVSQLCGYVVFKPMMYVVKTCIISISWEYGGFVSTLLPFQLPSIKESILISRISILLEKLRNSRIGEALLDHFIFSRKIVKLRHSADFLKNCYQTILMWRGVPILVLFLQEKFYKNIQVQFLCENVPITTKNF